MKYHIDQRILHIIYKQKEIKCKEFQNICEISKLYEGIDDVSFFIGFNFPMKIVPKENDLYKYIEEVDYVIVYKHGDIKTKNHELCHAKYFTDKNYKDSADALWNSLTNVSKKNIIDMLIRMKYKNNMDILIDEFQAYYYTEKSNFFGKNLFTI
jgi:hypothetical protein